MAQKGTYTALQQLRPVAAPNFGEVARDVADREIAREKREEVKRDKRLAQQSKIAESFGEDYNTLTDVITGTESIDEAFAKGVGQARDMMGDIYKQIQTTPSLANDVNTQLKLQNLRNYAKNLKTSSDKITEFNQTLAAGVEDGSLSAWNDKHLNIGDSIYRQKNLTVGVDSQGRAIGATVQVDDNGEVILGPNGKPIAEELRLPQILEGGGLPELIPVYNMASEAQKIGPDLGKRVIKNTDGSFSHNEYQLFEEIEPDVRNLVKGYIGDVKNPTAIAKSIWTDTLGNKATDLDEADMQDIENAYTNVIKSFYDETAKQTTDFGAKNAAIKESNRKREAKEIEGETVVSGFTVVTDQDEKIEKKEFVGVTGDLQGMATTFALPTNQKTKESNTTVVGPNGNKVVVTQVHLLDSGELAYSGFELRGKVTGSPVDPDGEDLGNLSSNVMRKKIGGGADTDDPVLTAVAKAYGLSNEGQLKKLLQKKMEKFSNKVPTKDVSKMTAAEKIKFYSNQ